MISPQLQMKAVSEYCGLRGYRIVRVIEDLDLSGRFWKTRQVDQAIEMLEHDEADVIVVWRWSRVSRNRLDWAVALGRVDAAGGRLESASEGFDTSTATGKFARGMLAEFAAFESDRIADVWREVRDRRVSLGLAPWGHEQFGYRRVAGGYVIDKKTGPILRELYRRYTEGQSFETLTRWLARRRIRAANSTRTDARWGVQPLLKMMDKGFGAGLITVSGEFFPGAHEPILSQAEWDAYLARRETTRHQPRVTAGNSLLTGLVQCSCGQTMTLHRGPVKLRFVCARHAGPRRRSSRAINEDRLTGMLYRWLLRLSGDPRHAAAAQRDAEQYALAASERARGLGQRISAGDDSEATRREFEAAEAASLWRNPAGVARALTEDWNSTSDAVKRGMLTRIVDHVEVHTSAKVVTLTVHTTWGTRSSYFSQSQCAYACEPPAPGDEWLTAGEALQIAKVDRATLRAWREDGFLPLARPDECGHYRYARSDLERVLAAPRKGKLGIDHHALRQQLSPAGPDTFLPASPSVKRRLRKLPPGLIDELQALRAAEVAAYGLLRRRAAITQTGAVMLAATEAGWHNREIAAVTGVTHQAVYKRIAVARGRRFDPAPHLIIEPPAVPARSSAFRSTPASERERLTVNEAAAYAHRCQRTIVNWRRAGLLPNTDDTTATARLYTRHDIDRVLAGQTHPVGVDYQTIRDQISELELRPTLPN